MAANLISVDHDTPMLLSPDIREWVKSNHIAHFIMNAIDQIDLSSAHINYRGSGSQQFPPATLLGLLILSYSSGLFSSRAIERATYDHLPTRMLCADTHPDHATICKFRCDNATLLKSTFSQVLTLAAEMRVKKIGGITLAIDGTKILANASKHSAISYKTATEKMQELDLEIDELLKKANSADEAPLEDGLTVEGEILRREEQKARIAHAKAAIEARAAARSAQVKQAQEEALERLEDDIRNGGKSNVKIPEDVSDIPKDKDQYNFTDPESRIMPSGGKNCFAQAYNAQAGVDIDSRLIVTQHVSDATNDKKELVPNVDCIVPEAGSVETILVDSGFVSEQAIAEVEILPDGSASGITVYGAVKRQKHGKSVSDLEKKADPVPPGPDAGFTERFGYRTATKEGKEKYKQRQQTIEPVFGIIKEAIGFRRFSLRGMAKVSLEWTLVCLSYNVRRMHSVLESKKAEVRISCAQFGATAA